MLAEQREWYALSVMELSRRLELSDGQIRRAVRALESRGLVNVAKDHDWHGKGEYGRLVSRDGDWVRAGMPTVALWISLPGRAEEWAERTRGELAEDTEWQQMLRALGAQPKTPADPV